MGLWLKSIQEPHLNHQVSGLISLVNIAELTTKLDESLKDNNIAKIYRGTRDFLIQIYRGSMDFQILSIE